MSTSKSYPGQNVLTSYLKKKGSKSSYCRFLTSYRNIIVASTFSDDWKDLDNAWTTHFMEEIERLNLNKILKEKINTEHLRYISFLQIFWKDIIKEYKENLAPATTSHSKETNKVTAKELLKVSHKKTEKNTEKITFKAKQKGELKRVREDDTDSTSNEHWKKQSRILEQNKNNLMYRQAVDNALLTVSAYESLIANNIIPFIKILKNSLLSRSRMSLSSANEPVLQAIVENLLPSRCCIPELALVINGKKPKGSGRFGYSDIFILSSAGNNNVILELKYISLVGLNNRDQNNNLGANELENLNKLLEKENEESVLKRPYSYWSKEEKKTKMTTIGEVLNNGMDQLSQYMKIISKGRAMNYSSSGVFDERVKITKSNSNKLKGFVILVIGFNRILWRSADEVKTNYMYNKI